ncbi:MAG: trypsin-like peptidase domain-containing protein [Coriobacteriales bacterium]|nr:trypsin-like peptidase domain-containing protein [Coriobacteriales bacterium]
MANADAAPGQSQTDIQSAGILQVKLYVGGFNQAFATGTGILLNPNTVVTNTHVLNPIYPGMDKKYDRFFKSTYYQNYTNKLQYRVVDDNVGEIKASILSTAPLSADITVLRLSTKITNYTPLRLADTSALLPGFPLILKSYPFLMRSETGQAVPTYQDGDLTTQTGYVVKSHSLNGVSGFTQDLATSATTGGPLFNQSGQVVGFDIFSKSLGGRYAVDSEYLKSSLDSLGISYNQSDQLQTGDDEQAGNTQPSGIPLWLLIVFAVVVVLLAIVVLILVLGHRVTPERVQILKERTPLPPIGREASQSAAIPTHRDWPSQPQALASTPTNTSLGKAEATVQLPALTLPLEPVCASPLETAAAQPLPTARLNPFDQVPNPVDDTAVDPLSSIPEAEDDVDSMSVTQDPVPGPTAPSENQTDQLVSGASSEELPLSAVAALAETGAIASPTLETPVVGKSSGTPALSVKTPVEPTLSPLPVTDFTPTPDFGTPQLDVDDIAAEASEHPTITEQAPLAPALADEDTPNKGRRGLKAPSLRMPDLHFAHLSNVSNSSRTFNVDLSLRKFRSPQLLQPQMDSDSRLNLGKD